MRIVHISHQPNLGVSRPPPTPSLPCHQLSSFSNPPDNYDVILMLAMTTMECPRSDKLCCERFNGGEGDLARGLLSHGQVQHQHYLHSTPSLNCVFTLAFHHQRQPQKLGPNKPSKLLASKSITTTTTSNKYKSTTTTNTIAMSREFLENHSRVMAGTTLTVAVSFHILPNPSSMEAISTALSTGCFYWSRPTRSKK